MTGPRRVAKQSTLIDQTLVGHLSIGLNVIPCIAIEHGNCITEVYVSLNLREVSFESFGCVTTHIAEIHR